jgi:hypothetical protein
VVDVVHPQAANLKAGDSVHQAEDAERRLTYGAHASKIQKKRKTTTRQAATGIPEIEHVPAPDRWTKTFTDPRRCAAIVDRLTYGGNIIETGTDSD